MNAIPLLRRAHDFIRQAQTWDWNEDRCVMGAVHLQEDIRAFLASCDTHPKDGDAKQAPLVSGAVPEGQTPNLQDHTHKESNSHG